MNNDIKEILDYFNKYVNDKYETYTIVDENTKAIKVLLDYITNLQEKYNDLLEIHKIENSDIQELQEKIDKSIEYLNNNTLFNFEPSEVKNINLITDTKAKEDLLNILQG